MMKLFEELALFGGIPTFSETLHIGRPNIGSPANLLVRINDILDRRWLTNSGVYVSELEQRIAELMKVKHCIAMCNGTVALEIVARALGMKGEVIVPSFYFYCYCTLPAVAGYNPCVLRYRSKDAQH